MAIALALLLRLGFMPFTMHSDLLFTNYFPYFLSYRNVWDIYGYFGGHYLAQGHTYYAPLVYYVVGFFQWLLRPLNPGFGGFMEHVHGLMYAGTTRSMADYLNPFPPAQRYQFVWMMKLPYLLADAACVGVISTIFDSSHERRRAVLFWLFSPVLLFSVYVFGTYRIYPAFLVWVLIAMVLKNKKVWACVALGCLCLMDNFPWLLLVPSLMILEGDWRLRLRLFLIAMVPFTLVFGTLYISSHGTVAYAYVSPVLEKAAFQSLTNHYAREVTFVCKGLFVIFYAWILLEVLQHERAIRELDLKERAELFVWMNAAVLFLFYATFQTLAHYFMWILPFFVFLQAKGEPWRPGWSWLLIGLLFFFNLDKRTLNWGLFMPVDPDGFLSLPSLHEVMERWLPWGKAVAAARLAFSALCAAFIWKLFERRVRPLLGTAKLP